MGTQRPTSATTLSGPHKPAQPHHWGLDSAHPASCVPCGATNSRGTSSPPPPPPTPPPPPLETPTSSNGTQTPPPGSSVPLARGVSPTVFSPIAEGSMSIPRQRVRVGFDTGPDPPSSAPASPATATAGASGEPPKPRKRSVGFGDIGAEPALSASASPTALTPHQFHLTALPDAAGADARANSNNGSSSSAPAATSGQVGAFRPGRATTGSASPKLSFADNTLNDSSQHLHSPSRMRPDSGSPTPAGTASAVLPRRLSIGGFLPESSGSFPSSPNSSRSPSRGPPLAQQAYASIQDEMNARAVSPNAERGLLWVVPRSSFAEMQADWSTTRAGMALEMKQLAGAQRAEAILTREVASATQDEVAQMRADFSSQMTQMQQAQREQADDLRRYVVTQVDAMRTSVEALTSGLTLLYSTMARQSPQSDAAMPTVTVRDLARAAMESMVRHEISHSAPSTSPRSGHLMSSHRPSTPEGVACGLAVAADRVARDLRLQHNTILSPTNIAGMQRATSARARLR